MELHNIQALLDKYFDAETTTAEENQLKAYFASGSVAPEFEPYGPMFGYFAKAKQETPTRPVPVYRRRPVIWASVAASVLVLISVGVTLFNTPSKPQDLGTFDDPEVAYRETQKALALLSGNVNKGVESVKYVEQYESAKEKVFIE
jgi:hypothetical protein